MQHAAKDRQTAVQILAGTAFPSVSSSSNPPNQRIANSHLDSASAFGTSARMNCFRLAFDIGGLSVRAATGKGLFVTDASRSGEIGKKLLSTHRQFWGLRCNPWVLFEAQKMTLASCLTKQVPRVQVQ